MITNNDIKKASENFYINKNELYGEIVTSENKARKPRLLPLRRIAAVLVAAAIFLAGCTTAYAVSPEFRNYINLWFIGNDKKQDKVPDGYKGIYTVKDLDNIRNDLSKKYILMNDLEFSDSDFAESGAYKDGWAAIGDDENPFTGEFDGNGHVISNIKLNGSGRYVGLFGSVNNSRNNYFTSYNAPDNSVSSEENNSFDESYKGIIKNLGLNGVTVDVTICNENYGSLDSSKGFNGYIGTIIAYGDYVADCYVENAKIKITLDDFEPIATSGQNADIGSSVGLDINIGGLCGYAFVIDSCYVDADIDIIDNNNYEVNTLAGGISSNAKIAVTSCFSGNITSSGENSYTGNMLSYETFIPNIITQKRLYEVVEAIKKSSSALRDSKQFQAFFQKIKTTQRTKDLLMNNADTSAEYLALEPHVTFKELKRLENILLKAYNEEDFRQGTKNEGVKSNINYCYTLERGKSYEQSHFENFDFEKIWVMKDGVPKLQIFE